MGAGRVVLTRPERVDGTPATFLRNLDAAYADVGIRAVIAVGPGTGTLIAGRSRLPKPTILPFAVPRISGLPAREGSSGRANLAYIAGYVDVERDFRQLLQVVRTDHVAVLVGREVLRAIPGAEEMVRDAAAALAIRATIVPFDTAGDTDTVVHDALAGIPADAGAVYLGNLGAFPEGTGQALIDGLIEMRMPSFTIQGVDWVERGILATATPPEDMTRRTRRAAIFTQRALDGEDLATFPIGFGARTELVINMRTARAIGAWPRFEVLTEARLLHDEPARTGPPLTLRDAVRYALEGNLSLHAAEIGVRSGREDVLRARAALLPSLSASGNFAWIDPDGAFIQSERQLQFGLNLQQVLYSPLAWMSFHANQASQTAREREFDATRLDTVLAAVESYLNVLRVQTGERLNQENLARARLNLSAAEVRVQVGAAGREEVFRWEIEIAESRVAVVSAGAQKQQAIIQLNRTLNRDLEARVSVEEPDDPLALLAVDARVYNMVDNPWTFEHFRDFMAEEAAENSPEVRQLRALRLAQDRLLEGRRRAFIPDVVATGGITAVAHRSGAGATPPPGIPQDDFSWQVGIGLSWNLYDGGARYAEIRQAELERSRIDTQLDVIRQQIDQRIRAALHQISADYTNMTLRQDAARAAGRNFEMVSDAYSQGTVDIIRLIDAQTQALQSSLAAANAMYDFMLAFLRMERAVGAFGFEMDETESDDFYERAAVYLADARERALSGEVADTEEAR